MNCYANTYHMGTDFYNHYTNDFPENEDLYAQYANGYPDNDYFGTFARTARVLDAALAEALLEASICYREDGLAIPPEVEQDFHIARRNFYIAFGEVQDSLVEDANPLPYMLLGAMLQYGQDYMRVLYSYGNGYTSVAYTALLPIIRDFDFDNGTDDDLRCAMGRAGLTFTGLAVNRAGVNPATL